MVVNGMVRVVVNGDMVSHVCMVKDGNDCGW